LGKPPSPQEIADAELLDIGQAAAFLNVSEASLRRWTNAGRLACLRVGQRRERRFRRDDLLGFLEGQASTIVPSGSPAAANGVSDGPASPGTISRGSHLCAVYSNDLGRTTLVVPFLLEGLNEGSVCFLVGPVRATSDILRNLKRKRPSIQDDVDAGRLIQSEYHLGPRAQVRYFRALLDKQIADGAQSFRIVGDLWGMRSRASEEALLEYEADYDRLIARRFPVVTLCVYDARRFSGVEILDALKGHRDTFRYPLERALA
jgi:transcriptional repressor of dcmA and dcmR